MTVGRRALLAAALLLVAANLRPAIVALSPVLPEIRRTTGLASTLAGLLTTLPLACFGLFAFATPRLARRYGEEHLLAAVVAVLVAAICLRLAPSTLALFAGTTLAGAAIAVGNVVLPGLVKRAFPDRVALMTGCYATALAGGAALASGTIVPLEHATGLGWRGALGLWSLPAAAALVLAVPVARTGHRSGRDQPARPAFELAGDPVARAVTAYMGLQSLEFYASVAWLPSFFQSHGLGAGTSGWLVSYLSLVSIPAALGAPVLGRRLRGHRSLVVACVAGAAVGLAGLLVAPTSLAELWMTVLGLAQGASLSLALGFIAERAPDPARVGQLSTLAQGAGYTFAALGPVTIGALHELTGGWDVPLLVLLGLLAGQLAAGLAAARERRAGTALVGPDGVACTSV